MARMLNTMVSFVKRTAGGVLPVSLYSFFAVVILPASRAYGVQSHGGAEGLVSHQIGHFLFTIGMIFLLLRITRAGLSGAGWQEFKGFLWFIIFWNLLTFTGHWMKEAVATERFVRHSGQVTAFQVEGVFDMIFYLTRLDHLLLLPAFFLLLLAIRKWGQGK